MEYKYYLAQLDENEAALYFFVYDRISNYASFFEVEASVETVHRVVKAIMLDNPELFWFEGKWRAAYESDCIRVFPNYKVRKNYGELNGFIENAVKNILQSCTGSDIENIKVVYDWLLNNIQYSYSDNDQTVEGAFIDKKAICKGIAKAFQLLMNKLNIPSFLIEGTLDRQTSHIWNIVFVNERFYHIDVTMGYQRFADLFCGMDRNKHYPCFMVSDKTIAVTHKIYPGQFPNCADDFDLDQFFVNQLDVPAKLKTYGTFKYLDKGSTCTVLLVIGNDSQYALKIVEAGDNEAKYNSACAELEKMKILSSCAGVVNIVDSVVSEYDAKVFMLLRYYKSLTIRRKESDFDLIKNTLQLGIDVLNALIECRDKGIYHLDIQPKNIYFDEKDKAVLGDFSGSIFEDELKELKRGRGTLAFMAPEVYSKGVYGQASEIYSLGIVLYSLLNNGKLPFAEENDFSLAIKKRLRGQELIPPKNCNNELWDCLKKMCSFDIKDRYEKFEEVEFLLKKMLENGSC